RRVPPFAQPGARRVASRRSPSPARSTLHEHLCFVACSIHRLEDTQRLDGFSLKLDEQMAFVLTLTNIHDAGQAPQLAPDLDAATGAVRPFHEQLQSLRGPHR